MIITVELDEIEVDFLCYIKTFPESTSEGSILNKLKEEVERKLSE